MHVCLVCRRERKKKTKICLWLLLAWFTCVPPESHLCLIGVSRLFQRVLSRLDVWSSPFCPCSMRTNPESDCVRVCLQSAAGAAEARKAGEAGKAFQGRLMCPLLCLDALKVHKAGTAQALSSTCGRVCLWNEAGPQSSSASSVLAARGTFWSDGRVLLRLEPLGQPCSCVFPLGKV